ncbi:MAG: ribonuclease HI [Firmicutes bacterium]|nr:ribonuclease HI [Bacillota bacterium]
MSNVSLPEVTIYTDGACSGNPGPGGWAALLRYGSHEKELAGYEAHTTNQRMELMAAIKGLEALKKPCSVQLHSDSAYLINAFHRKWLVKWQRNGWLNVKKQPVENQDLWKRLVTLTEKHQVRWVKVEGHSDDELNNRCDYLAKQAIKENAPTGNDELS